MQKRIRILTLVLGTLAVVVYFLFKIQIGRDLLMGFGIYATVGFLITFIYHFINSNPSKD